MGKELQNLELFKEVQAEKFYQKKVDVANGVMEMGKILCETKEKLPHGEWIPWLEDSRVNFKPNQAQRYMRIAKELGTNTSYQEVFDKISLNKLYELASAPEETREDIINNSSNSKELEENIKKYQEEKKRTKELEKQLKEQKDKHEKEIRILEKENKELNEELDNKEPITITKTVEKVVEKQIIPEDYEELKEKAEDYDFTRQTLLEKVERNKELNKQILELKDNEKLYDKRIKELEAERNIMQDFANGTIGLNNDSQKTYEVGLISEVKTYVQETINKVSSLRYNNAVTKHLDDDFIKDGVIDLIDNLDELVKDLRSLIKDDRIIL